MIRKSVLITALATLLGSGVAHAEYRLSILHMNDQHSRIEPINKYGSTCSADDAKEGKCFGGYARMKTKIDERRDAISKDGNVLVLDAGDEFSGSLFFTTYQGKVAAELLNDIGVDAMAVGNHEFDRGPEVLGEFAAKVKFPVLSGNTTVYYEPSLKEKISAYKVIEKGGEKIAIVGVTTAETKIISSPGDNVAFLDPVEYLQTVLPEIKKEGINKIIVLSHCGLEEDQKMAALEDVDAVIGGHSHVLLSNTIKDAQGPYPIMVRNPAGVDVPVVQAGAYSRYLGELNLVFDDDGKVTSASGDTVELDSSVKPDEGFVARIKEFAAPIEELKNKKIGEAAEAIGAEKSVCRAKECPMGNLVADAMLERVKSQGMDVAIQNGGGLRAGIEGGDVTMGSVLEVLPFQNTLATFKLSGADLKSSLESGLSEVEEGGGRFPQVAGMRYAWSPSGAAGTDRLKSVEIRTADGWAPIEDNKAYGVVSNNFMRAGGDGYSLFKTNAKEAYDYGPSLEDVVADYIANHSPYKPYTDGRIVNCKDTPDGAGCAEPAKEIPAVETTADNPAGTDIGTKEPVVGGTSITEAAKVMDKNLDSSMKTADDLNKKAMEGEIGKPADNAAMEKDAASMAKKADEVIAKDMKADMDEAKELDKESMAGEIGKEPEMKEAEMAEEKTAENAPAMEKKEEMAEEKAADTGAMDKKEEMTEENAAKDGAMDKMEAVSETAEEKPAMEKIPRGKYTIKEGDTLWNIAERAYGNGSQWKKIRNANRRLLRGGRRLKLGTAIRIP